MSVNYGETWEGERCSECGRKVKSWHDIGGLILCAICYANYVASIKESHEQARPPQASQNF